MLDLKVEMNNRLIKKYNKPEIYVSNRNDKHEVLLILCNLKFHEE